MSHFRIEIKTLSKSKGQSAAAANIYDTRERHIDKSDLAKIGQINMPNWAKSDVSKFWNAADKFERENGLVARRAILSFPRQLPSESYEKYIREWLSQNCPKLPASWAIHFDSETNNPHVHILISERMTDGIEREPELFFKRANSKNPSAGGCRKADIGSTRKDWLSDARQSWASILNAHLPPHEHVSHLSNSSRGLPPPQRKFGAAVLALESRGIRTEIVAKILESELKKGEYNEQNITNDKSEGSRRSAENSAISRTERPRRLAQIGSTNEPDSRSNQGRERPKQQANKDSSGANGQRREAIIDGQTDSLDNVDDYRLADIDCLSANNNSAAKPANASMPANKRSSSMQNDLTFKAVQKQISAMQGVTEFEIGILNQQSGKMMNLKVSAGDIGNQIQRLKRENARGNNIYVRPSRDSVHPYCLMDDLTHEHIAELEREGFQFALQIETSPNNYQVLIKLPSPKDAAGRKGIERALSKRFGSDPGCCDGQHFFRLGGFTNRKPKHRKNGQFPYVLVKSTNPNPTLSANAKNFLELPPTLVGIPERDLKKITEKSPSYLLQTGKKSDLATRVAESHQHLKFRYGNEYDASKSDLQIAKTLLNQGWDEQSVKGGLRDGSPNLAERKIGHIDDYIQRTVSAAICHSISPVVTTKDGARDELKFQSR